MDFPHLVKELKLRQLKERLKIAPSFSLLSSTKGYMTAGGSLYQQPMEHGGLDGRWMVNIPPPSVVGANMLSLALFF